MSHDHHHHDHHMETTTGTPNVTAMVMNSVINATNQMMAMAHAHHEHEHNTTDSGHEGHGDHTVDDGGQGSHDGHGTGDGMGHMMDMTFHARVAEQILFKEWNVTTVGGMIGSVVGIFIMALLYEGLKFLREHLYRQHYHAINYSTVAVTGQDGKSVTELHKITKNKIFGWPHLLQTSLHMVQILVSYFLMLIFMTYNVWLCLGILVGSGLGYFIFGWRKATIVDLSEHCH